MDEFAFDLFPLMGRAKEVLITLGLSAARLSGLMIVMPVFKRSELGRVFLVAISMGMALPIMGGLSGEIAALPTGELPFMVALTAKEFGVGMLLGLFFGIPFWAIQLMGEVVDHQRAIGESGMFDPATGSQGSVLSALFGLVAITIFVSEGGLMLIAETIYASYDIWTLSTFVPGMDGASLAALTALLAQVMLYGMLIAAPLVFVFLLSDFTVMALGRTTSRIDISYTLPLVKNLIFGVFALLYLQFLVGYMRDGLERTQLVNRLLELVVGP